MSHPEDQVADAELSKDLIVLARMGSYLSMLSGTCSWTDACILLSKTASWPMTLSSSVLGCLMRMLISFTVLTSTLLTLGCSKPEERPTVKMRDTRSLLQELDAIRAREVSRVPTLPEGGLIKGKLRSLSIEENIARQNSNRLKPIVFGQSFAGISMKSTRNESKAILSEPNFSTDTGLDVYGEGIHITWGEGLNPVPKSVRIFTDYQGPLELPAPYPSVPLKESLGKALETDPDRRILTKTLARTFGGKDATYDCFAAGACQVEQRGEESFIDLPQGNLVLWKDAIYVVDFATNTNFTPKSKAPMLFPRSLAGVDYNMNRTQVDASLGEPYKYPDQDVQLYDAKTIRVEYRASGLVERVEVRPGYKGTLKVGSTERGLGTSFADLIVGKDDPKGLEMMQALAKILLGKEADAGFDCTKSDQGALCSAGFSSADNVFRVQVLNMVFEFSGDEKRTLLSVYMFNPTAQ